AHQKVPARLLGRLHVPQRRDDEAADLERHPRRDDQRPRRPRLAVVTAVSARRDLAEGPAAASPERCEPCGRASGAPSAQRGAPVCGSHRTVIETALGVWSRCPSCTLRNKIRESPLVTSSRFERELELFFLWVLVLVVVVVVAVAVVY